MTEDSIMRLPKNHRIENEIKGSRLAHRIAKIMITPMAAMENKVVIGLVNAYERGKS